MLVDTKSTLVFINIFLFIIKIYFFLGRSAEVKIMGRPKGGTNKTWSKEEKYSIILPIINLEKSCTQHAKDLGMSKGMIAKWFNLYQNGGIDALENKRKPGNPLTKYCNRKELSYTEQLEYENMKLKIENERLKKGYTQKEADQAKQRKSNKNNSK